MTKIERANAVLGPYTLTNSVSTSPSIPYPCAAGGVFIVDSVASGATTISWYVAFDPSLTPVPLLVGGVAATTAISAGNAYVLPDGLFAAPYIEGVTDAGTAVIRVSVKG